MIWVFASVVLVCAIVSPGFRKLLLILAVLLVLLGAGLYLYLETENQRRAAIPAPPSAPAAVDFVPDAPQPAPPATLPADFFDKREPACERPASINPYEME